MSRITVLVENTAAGQNLLAEHGLSYWIELGARRILFDTGQGMVLRHNAHKLGIPLETADTVVLSHGHYDHTGGLEEMLRTAPSLTLYCHPFALSPRYIRQANGTAREIGMPQSTATAAQSWPRVVWTTSLTEICPGLYATGPIPRSTAFEDTGGPFFEDEAMERPDTFPDDQALYVETKHGTLVLLGCAHAGIINTLRYVIELTGHRPVWGVAGGTHLVSASPERMNRTIDELRKLNMRRLMPAHCTGFFAMARLEQEFPACYLPCPVGTTIDAELP